MTEEEDNLYHQVNQILLFLMEGKSDSAIELVKTMKIEKFDGSTYPEFVDTLEQFSIQYGGGIQYLNKLSNGNLDITPPEDPFHKSYLVAQCKQLHSNLQYFTWQILQVSKGDLKQKVSFLGDFSLGFNKMIESLREKKILEEKISQQNEELRTINDEKDKLFSIIAHDLRSPFTALLGFTQILADQLATMSLEEVQEIAIDLLASANKLFALLENLLEWSKIQRGMLSYQPSPVSISAIALRVKEVVGDAAGKKVITVDSTIPENCVVLADEKMVESILRNLVFNAIKFTPIGGNISISSYVTTQSLVEISVRDSGIGMSPQLVSDLFKIDKKTAREGTEGEPSTGLGLIICKDLVEKHGGNIWATSEEGKGSTFHFTLPKYLE